MLRYGLATYSRQCTCRALPDLVARAVPRASRAGRKRSYHFDAPGGPPPSTLLPQAARRHNHFPFHIRPHGTYESSGTRTVGHLMVAPFLLGTLCWSTFFYQKHANGDLVAAAGYNKEAGGTRSQILGLFSMFKYLEISTDGPRLDLSPLAALVDWRGLMALAPTQSTLGLVYFVWSSLLHGVDNTVAFFPSLDIKPKLVRLGVLSKLEEGLQSEDPTVRLCAAYVVNRLVRNAHVARMVAARPVIVQGLVDMLEEEMLVEGGRFQGFGHSAGNASAEVFVTLLETLNNLVEGVVNKEAVILIGVSGGHDPVLGARPDDVLPLITPSLVHKASLMLRLLDLCDEHVGNAAGLFEDHRMSIYAKFFPGRVDDQVRRRMREVEAEVARFLGGISKDAKACETLLLERDVLAGLVPLARAEGRNASAFVHAVEAVHNVLDRYWTVKEQGVKERHSLPSAGVERGGLSDESAEESAVKKCATPWATRREASAVDRCLGQGTPSFFSSSSLLLPSHLTDCAIADAVESVAGREEGTLGRPFARLRSVYAMRCYISSMACLVVGGLYGVMRSAASFPLVPPVIAYSVNGIGAVMLNAGYGTYGLRNWLKQNTYVEESESFAAWTSAQAVVDVGVVTAIVRRHPYALLPMVAVNYFGFNSSPGTGMKRLDGMDAFFTLS